MDKDWCWNKWNVKYRKRVTLILNSIIIKNVKFLFLIDFV